ncbi:MAG TPA: hypothetical protein VJ724_14755, partial [Tahibacter sp.]|nr:hypothetical protein [Tahibacter sp.]
MSRIYAALSQAQLGPSLVLELGDLVVASKYGNTDRNRTARATFANPQSVGAGNSGRFEAAFYGDGSLADRAYVGFCAPAHSPSVYVGGSVVSYALNVGAGGVYCNGSLVAATPPVAKQAYIGVYLDRSSSPP